MPAPTKGETANSDNQPRKMGKGPNYALSQRNKCQDGQCLLLRFPATTQGNHLTARYFPM